MSGQLNRIPKRHEIAPEDTWDFSGVFPSDDAWNESLGENERADYIARIGRFALPDRRAKDRQR